MSFGFITINGRGRPGRGGGGRRETNSERRKTLGGAHIQEVFLDGRIKAEKDRGRI